MSETFQRSKQDWLLGVGLFCFFFSGAAGLIYQVVWTRMLTQIFGNTTYAIATVLSAFMAGLAIGSYLFGKIADRGKNDFLLYGILEAEWESTDLPYPGSSVWRKGSTARSSVSMSPILSSSTWCFSCSLLPCSCFQLC
jgi:MFS family permease